MFVPNLSVPEKGEKLGTDVVAPRADKIAAWIEELPRANPFEALRKTTEAVLAWNRVMISADKRFAALQAVLPVVLDLGQVLRRDYQDAELPLVDKKKPRAELMQQLWWELGNGYKLVTLDLILGLKAPQPPELLAPVLYQAIVALSNVLLEAYLVYGSEPQKTWYEIHQLFRCAESFGVLEKPVSPAILKPSNGNNINQAYGATLIAHLADPYHLLPGEILKFLAEIHRYTPALQLSSIVAQMPLPGTVIVDIDKDVPPRLMSLSGGHEIINVGKQIEANRVRDALAKAAEERHTPTSRSSQKSTLGERVHREMYLRILKSFVPRQERQSKREENAKQICMVAGMEACHFFANNRRPFNPEATLNSTSPATALPPDLSLADSDDMPWFEDLDDALASAGRNTVFAPAEGLSKPEDVWTQIYHSSATSQAAQQAPISESPNTTCDVRDTSQNGLSASISLGSINLRVRVGSLIALQTPEGSQLPDAPWSIGAVRWLKVQRMQRIDLGIEILANDALGVATKAIQGVGKGSEYLRAMLIPKADPSLQTTTLIAPPSIYDEGTTLLINTGDHIYKARIIHLIEGASSFARYNFRLIE